MSQKSTCPRDPEIDRLDTTPESLNLTSANTPIAIRRSGRSTKPPDMLTYTETPTIKRNKAVVKEIKKAVELKETKKIKKVKTDDTSKQKNNRWAIHRAWLNKLRVKRQDPEYIKQQQAIVAKYRTEYVPYKWRPNLSTYENIYRSQLLKKATQSGVHPPHDIIVKEVNEFIRTSLPITMTSPLSLTVSPEQLEMLEKEGAMSLEDALAIIERVDTANFLKLMQALRTIQKIPSDTAIASRMSPTIAKSIPIAKPVFTIPKDINERIMIGVNKRLQEKYSAGFDISSLDDPKYRVNPNIDPSCDADVISDSILTDLQNNIITDRDVALYNREIVSNVMKMHGITNPVDPRLRKLIDNYMRTLPELTDDDFESGESSTFVTDSDDMMGELDKTMQNLSIDSSSSSLSYSPSKKTIGKRRLGEGFRKTRRRLKKYFKKRGSKKTGSNKPKSRSRKKRKQRGGILSSCNKGQCVYPG